MRRVQAGETIEVTDRGRPVAVLAPLPVGDPIERLRAAGDLVPSQQDLAGLPEPLPLAPGQEPPSRCSSASGGMSADRATYLDASALVKLAVREPESEALRRYIGRRRPLVSSALSRTEVARALLPLGPEAVRRGLDVVAGVDLIRINDRVLHGAGAMLAVELRALDAIHLATAQQPGASLVRIVTYDDRMAAAAMVLGWPVAAPA